MRPHPVNVRVRVGSADAFLAAVPSVVTPAPLSFPVVVVAVGAFVDIGIEATGMTAHPVVVIEPTVVTYASV
ncbi:hypothetical protein AB0H00_29195 [Nocardia sp. NPDC023852]|uniref:hypothetical protein n=1 Tax=Nocardia sp. NPDC023852 TaxID=3154697 RepID=UPI0033C2EC30